MHFTFNRDPLHRLQLLHRKLDEELRAEESRRLPDGERVARLKKFKLAVKDRLWAFSARSPEMSRA